jgi:hypothetical protein
MEQETLRPAAHALLEVQVDGTTWYGVADARGCIAVLFPYPTAMITLGGSPPRASQPLWTQRWEVTLRVRYAPAGLEYPTGAEVPDLRSIINQPPGLIWSSQSALPTQQRVVELAFGQDLVVRTDALSALLIA